MNNKIVNINPYYQQQYNPQFNGWDSAEDMPKYHNKNITNLNQKFKDPQPLQENMHPHHLKP